MEPSRPVAVSLAVGIAGALPLCWAAIALAQEAAPAAPPPAEKRQVLEKVVETRSEGNEDAAKVQERIDTISDQTDELLAEYRTTLKQIDAIDLYNGQMRDLIGAQEEELASLSDQLGRVDEVGRSVTPLMLRMIDALEAFVGLDVPFLLDERRERAAELRKLMGRADVTTPEKFRQIMEAYQIENEYGRTIEAYRDTLEIGGRETTVDFLRFGRIALVYQSLDESVRGAWDQETRSWIPLDASYRSPIREGLRIARKQAAPDLIRLPLPAPTEARSS
jgi:hypothetical protein